MSTMPYYKVVVSTEKVFVVVDVPSGLKYPDSKAIDEVLDNALVVKKNEDILEVTSELVDKNYLELKKYSIDLIKYQGE